jgi:hypothetical protein
MTETTQPDPQVVRCPWCEGHPRPCADHQSARKPLTVADIPAGQGPASLFLMRDALHDAVGLWFKDGDGAVQWCRWEAAPGDSPASTAYWDHLAATLPHVTD